VADYIWHSRFIPKNDREIFLPKRKHSTTRAGTQACPYGQKIEQPALRGWLLYNAHIRSL